MVRRRIIPLLLLVLLFFGSLSLVGRMSYRAGWTEGYFTRQQVERPAEVPPQVGPYHYPGWGWGGSSFIWFIGGLLKFGLFLLLFGLLFKVLFFQRRGGFRRCHGRKPHWSATGEETPYEKKPEDVEPHIGSA